MNMQWGQTRAVTYQFRYNFHSFSVCMYLTLSTKGSASNPKCIRTDELMLNRAIESDEAEAIKELISPPRAV